MGAGAATIAFDVNFNREVLGVAGRYFATAADVDRADRDRRARRCRRPCDLGGWPGSGPDATTGTRSPTGTRIPALPVGRPGSEFVTATAPACRDPTIELTDAGVADRVSRYVSGLDHAAPGRSGIRPARRRQPGVPSRRTPGAHRSTAIAPAHDPHRTRNRRLTMPGTEQVTRPVARRSRAGPTSRRPDAAAELPRIAARLASQRRRPARAHRRTRRFVNRRLGRYLAAARPSGWDDPERGHRAQRSELVRRDRRCWRSSAVDLAGRSASPPAWCWATRWTPRTASSPGCGAADRARASGSTT